MGEETGISWAHATLNYWIGCTKVSPACDGCYAERDWDKRYHRVMWGPHGPRSRTTTWRQPYKWQREAQAFFAKHGEKRRVFVNSLSDFGDNHPTIKQEWRDAAHKAWKECPDVIFMILTKRPQNLLKPGFLPDDWSAENYPNVWIGTTTENQEEADRRTPHLLKIDAALRFLSCGPLLGGLDLRWIAEPDMRKSGVIDCLLGANWVENDYGTKITAYRPGHEGRVVGRRVVSSSEHICANRKIHLVIVEGESGPDARPTHPDWVRNLRDQCAASRTVFHFKQWGEWGTACFNITTGNEVFRQFTDFQHWVNKASTWVSGGICLDTQGNQLRIGKAFMEARDLGRFPVTIMHRIGVKRAGRTLDGVIHDEMPK